MLTLASMDSWQKHLLQASGSILGNFVVLHLKSTPQDLFRLRICITSSTNLSIKPLILTRVVIPQRRAYTRGHYYPLLFPGRIQQP